MVRPDRRRLWTSFGVLVLILGSAGAPWPVVRRSFAVGYCASLNGLLLDHVTFGRGGHARLLPGAEDKPKTANEVTTDARLELKVDGYQGELTIGINTRRDAYLPLLLLFGVLVSAPLSLRQRARCLGTGLAIEAVIIAAGQWLALVRIFAVDLQGVYQQLSSGARGAIDLAFRTLLVPPGNRFVIPLLIAAMLIWMQQKEWGHRP